MSEISCPVSKTIAELDAMIASNRIKTPKSRRIAEEIRVLMEDVAWGRAGKDHLSAMAKLSQELVKESDTPSCATMGNMIGAALTDHSESFQSHVNTHNCPTGECVNLAPAPCQMACPAGIDIPTYVTLIGMGRYDEAIEVIRKDNPFPWVCGLVCTRPCEFMCVRARIDTPVSIKFLKAYAAEQAMSEGQYRNPPQAPPNGKKVCIVGAGPAGMTAAYYLALKGYGVRVIEQLPMAGGMLMVGIPRYRLPREVIDREVDMIRELGVEFEFNTRFGWRVHINQLRKEGFEAFLFTIGAHKCSPMRVPGENDFAEVFTAVSFLREVALGDREKPGDKVLIIGGGNVAIDSARTCIRLGCKEVVLAYRRTRAEMPADEEEIEQAEEEGVQMNFLTIPVEIVGEEYSMTKMHCVRAELVAREGSTRMSPVPIFGSDFYIEIDAIIVAVGQRIDHTIMSDLPDLDWTRRNTINVNRATMETSLEGVFAAGDDVLGPATVIEAIAGGKKAASAIDRYLHGLPQRQLPPVPVRRSRTEFLKVPASTKMSLKRPEMPLLNYNRRRVTFQQVELGYEENAVREEARRCLRCDICRRCGDCVAVCRDRMGIDALHLGYLDFDHPVKSDFRNVAEKCIACGACAENCKNNAMQIHDEGDERILSLCGIVLNRQKLVFCESCGAVLGPAKYLDYIDKRISQQTTAQNTNRYLCLNCSRKQTAQQHDEQVVPLF
ncbi:FAD-dependent oxidoreductase [Desulfococcaceae bacterium HSG9]|nr:FAD-dependent oxidoreductase [Desulfococcaceae bacterium HSG9]